MSIYILFYFLFYFTFGSSMLYFSQFFSAVGLSGVNSGTIFALGSFLAMIFQPFLGYINDKTRKTKELLIIVTIVLLGALLLMNYVTSFIGLLTLYTIYAVAVFCEMPLMDTLALSTKYHFGKVRLWGSIGFAVGGLVSGRVISIFGYSSFLYIGVVFSILTIIMVIRIPKNKEIIEDKIEKEKINLKKLLTNKKYIIFVVVAMLFLGTANSSNSYFAVYFKNIGGSMTLLGVTIFLMTLSEVPLIGLSTRLVSKKSAEFAVTLAVFILTIRWGVYFFIPNPAMITGSFLFQGASVGLFFGVGNLFVRDIVERNTLGTAIMIFMSAGSLGGMFIQYICGIVIENSSPVNIYGMFGLLGAIALILMLINQRIKTNK